MSRVLVIGDEQALAKAIGKHGAENVWWAVSESVSTRQAGTRAGLMRYHHAGEDADREAFDTVIGGEEKKSTKPVASKKKEATVKKDE